MTTWLRVRDFVNAASGITQTTNVINGFSGLILELYVEEGSTDARSAIGVAAAPLGFPVVVEAGVEIDRRYTTCHHLWTP